MEAVFLLAAVALIGWAATRESSLPFAQVPGIEPSNTRGDTKGADPAPLDPGIKVPEGPAMPDVKDQIQNAWDRLMGSSAAATSGKASIPMGGEIGISNSQGSNTDFAKQLNIAQAQLVNRHPDPRVSEGEAGYLPTIPGPTDEVIPFGVDPARLSVLDMFAIDAASFLQKDPNVHVGLADDPDPFSGFGV